MQWPKPAASLRWFHIGVSCLPSVRFIYLLSSLFFILSSQDDVNENYGGNDADDEYLPKYLYKRKGKENRISKKVHKGKK